KGLLDQQAAKARAVDEEVAADDLPVSQLDGSNRIALRRRFDVHDFALGADDAAALGVLAQIGRIKTGVELVGVRERGQQRSAIRDRRAEPIQRCGDDRQRVIADRCRVAGEAAPQPKMVEGNAADCRAVGAEGMNIRVAGSSPAAKLDAELEGRPGARHEIPLIEPEPLVEAADVGDGRLAHPHRTDLLRLDETHGHAPAEAPCERRRGHPSGGAAADDYDRADRTMPRGRAHGAKIARTGIGRAGYWNMALTMSEMRRSVMNHERPVRSRLLSRTWLVRTMLSSRFAPWMPTLICGVMS